MQRIAVTAAGGALGQSIIAHLKARLVVQMTPQGEVVEGSVDETDRLVAIARNVDGIADLEVEKRRGDYTSVRQMTEAFAGIDTVVLVSSPAGAGDRELLHQNVIDAAVAAGVRKVIYTSVIGNGDEMNTLYAPMAQINRKAEQALQDSGLTWIAARNGLYLEFDVAHIVNAAAEGVFRNNGGEGYCAYITRNELAMAYAELALSDHCDNQVLNLVGEANTQQELVDMVNAQTGGSVRYETISDDECFAKLAPVRGAEVANMLTGCYQAIRNGAFDVESDFETILGVPCKPVQFMISEVIAMLNAAKG